MEGFEDVFAPESCALGADQLEVGVEGWAGRVEVDEPDPEVVQRGVDLQAVDGAYYELLKGVDEVEVGDAGEVIKEGQPRGGAFLAATVLDDKVDRLQSGLGGGGRAGGGPHRAEQTRADLSREGQGFQLRRDLPQEAA